MCLKVITNKSFFIHVPLPNLWVYRPVRSPIISSFMQPFVWPFVPSLSITFHHFPFASINKATGRLGLLGFSLLLVLQGITRSWLFPRPYLISAGHNNSFLMVYGMSVVIFFCQIVVSDKVCAISKILDA